MSAPTVGFQNAPAELKAIPNWVGWKLITKDGETVAAKIPYDVKTGQTAKANDATTWTTFEEAAEKADMFSGSTFDGIGFELGGTDIAGIDFDAAINAKGEVDPYVLAILAVLGNPYTEKSPSGKGLHAFVSCDALPEGKRKMSEGHVGVEIYHGREKGRYFTFTGQQIGGDGVPRIADMELPYLLISQNQNKRFKALWLGDVESIPCGDKRSDADFALLSELAKLTKNDAAKMGKFFGVSALAQRRDKGKRKDYVERTIKAAIASQPATTAPVAESPNEVIKNGVKFGLPAVSGTHKDYVFEPISGSYEGLCPRGAVSAVGATSGAGKTTLMIQFLLAQRTKASFFGHLASAGYSFVMLGADRGEYDHMRTMESMHLPFDAFPFERLSLTSLDGAAVQAVTDAVESMSPMPEIVFIEGMDLMLTNGLDSHCVSAFLEKMQTVAEHYHLAIIGSMGSPKAKEGSSGRTITRDNLIGSGAWSRGLATVVTINFPNGDDSKGKRIVHVCPRRGKPEKYTMEFQDGQLVVVPDEPNEKDNRGGRLSKQVANEIEWFQAIAREGKTNPKKRWWTVQDLEEKFGLSHAAADNHVRNAFAKGLITMKPGKKTGRGGANEYQWNESESNHEWVEPGMGEDTL